MTGKPWLERDDWAGEVAYSRYSQSLTAHWMAAGVWIVLGTPVAIGWWRGDLAATPVPVRILLGIWLLTAIPIVYNAMVATVRARRFRDLRLELDPFPGSPGGQLGGSVLLPVRISGVHARAALSCFRRRWVERAKGGREARDERRWQAEVDAELSPEPSGTRARFVFDIPEGLPETGLPWEDHHRWVVRIAASVRGPDVDQAFEVPVYSHDPPLRSTIPFRGLEPAEGVFEARGVRIGPTAHGLEFVYGFGRYGGAALLALAFGIVFVVAGLAVGHPEFGFASIGPGAESWAADAASFMMLVLVGLGGAIFTLGLYLAANRLSVTIEDGRVVTRRWVLFVPLTREARVSDLEALEARVLVQRGYGPSAVPYYSVRGKLPFGGRVTLGDGIRGTYLKDRIMERLKAELELDEAGPA